MTQATQGIYVNTKPIKTGSNEYVCWLDIMGTRSTMSASLERATNHICRLHLAIKSAFKSELRVYPMLDGAYITTQNKQVLETFLQEVFSTLATEFLNQDRNLFRFIPKASIAFGPVVHGSDINSEVNFDLAADERIKNSLLFGLPVITANEGEKLAPPFGIFVDISARMFAPQPDQIIPFVWYKWFKASDEELRRFRSSITDYYAWCLENTNTLTYSEERILAHKKMALEYLSYQ